MSHNIHDLGDLVTVRAVFTVAEDESANDPDEVMLTVKAPDGTITTLVYGTDAEVIRDGVGEFHCDVDANQSGTWYYRWWATGDGQAGKENYFEIRTAQAVEEES